MAPSKTSASFQRRFHLALVLLTLLLFVPGCSEQPGQKPTILSGLGLQKPMKEVSKIKETQTINNDLAKICAYLDNISIEQQ